MNINKFNINELIEAKYNPRKNLKPGDSEYEKIKRSIQEFGYVDPIIINSDKTIVGGHQRYKVLKDLGYNEVECVVVDLDKNKEKLLNVALNKISGEWDMELLKNLMEDLNKEIDDLSLSGFDDNELQTLMENFKIQEVEEDDFDTEKALEEIKQPITKRGDVWKLGRHRLMCGDSTVITDVEKLMNNIKVDLLLTDPPYNVDYENKEKALQKFRPNKRVDDKGNTQIANDKLSDDKFKQFLIDAFNSANIVMKEGAVFYIWHADSEGYNFRGACKEIGWKVRQCLVWVKNNIVIGRQDYQWKHEPCLYGWKEGASHLWASDRKQTTILNFDKPQKNGDHPTMKPIALFDYQIKNNTKADDVVLDLFGGSGTTLIACEQNKRINYSMELDEKYCDVIIKRWEELTGQKAELIVNN